MKQAISRLVRRIFFKKTRRVTTSIETIPTELLTEIFARVAADSFTDIFNAKLSCKSFHEAAEDGHVYQHVNLDNFPIVAWNPLTEKQQAFLARCHQSQNPEIIYRQALLGYFDCEKVEEPVLKCLERAAKSNHVGALYVKCIVYLFSGDDELKQRGVKLLASMKMCKYLRRQLNVHREKLRRMLRMLWVKNPTLRHGYPVCCTREDGHKRKRGWVDFDENEDVYCEGCSADSEIKFLCEIFPRW